MRNRGGCGPSTRTRSTVRNAARSRRSPKVGAASSRVRRLEHGAHLVDFRTEQDVRYGDMAVLAPTNTEAQRWLRVLAKHGIPVISLMDYDGTPCEAVKVGTFHRVKSLDFAHVCIPDRNLFPQPQSAVESAEAYRERAALERRQMYVAITRARDSLWVGIHKPTAAPGIDPGDL